MQDFTAMKDVIAACRNAEQGLRGAANAVENPELKRIFDEYSLQRGRFATQLHEVAQGLGIHVDDPAGISGALYSGWMQLKGVLTGHDEHRILADIERAEDHSVQTYRRAISMNISEAVRSILESQLAEVQLAHNHIRTLLDSTAKPSSRDERTRHA